MELRNSNNQWHYDLAMRVPRADKFKGWGKLAPPVLSDQHFLEFETNPATPSLIESSHIRPT